MPKNKNTSKKRTRGTRKRALPRITPPSAITFYGPIRTKLDKQSADLTELVLVEDLSLTTTAGGLLNQTWSFENPSATIDWSNVIGLYDEFRTLGLEVEYIPNLEDCLNTAGLALLFTPVYSVIDRDSNGALTSYSGAAQYPSLDTYTLTKRWKKTMRMQGPSAQTSSGFSGESLWLNCTTPPATCGSIKIIATGLTASTSYGRVILRYRIQFRGRGL